LDRFEYVFGLSCLNLDNEQTSHTISSKNL